MLAARSFSPTRRWAVLPAYWSQKCTLRTIAIGLHRSQSPPPHNPHFQQLKKLATCLTALSRHSLQPDAGSAAVQQRRWLSVHPIPWADDAGASKSNSSDSSATVRKWIVQTHAHGDGSDGNDALVEPEPLPGSRWAQMLQRVGEAGAGEVVEVVEYSTPGPPRAPVSLAPATAPAPAPAAALTLPNFRSILRRRMQQQAPMMFVFFPIPSIQHS